VNSKLLISSLAIGAIAAGGATAHVRHASRDSAGSTYAAPAQPIPYAELDHYLHASRGERKSMEMATANGGASTGSTTNTSAVTTDSSQMNAPATPSAPAAAPADNNMPSAATPSAPTTTPDTNSATPQATLPATTPPPSSPQ